MAKKITPPNTLDTVGQTVGVGDWIVAGLAGTGPIEIGFARVVGITPRSKKFQIRQVCPRGSWPWMDQKTREGNRYDHHDWVFTEIKVLHQDVSKVWKIPTEALPHGIREFSDHVMCPVTYDIHLNGVPAQK